MMRKIVAYFKESVPEAEVAGMSEAVGWAGRLELPAGVNVVVLNPEVIWRQDPFLPGNLSLFLRILTDWMRPIHIMEGDRFPRNLLI